MCGGGWRCVEVNVDVSRSECDGQQRTASACLDGGDRLRDAGVFLVCFFCVSVQPVDVRCLW